MKPRGRRLLLGLAGVAVVAASPLLLREMTFFRVRRVEVVGARFLEPERIVEALARADGQNLFDPLGDARRRADSVPGIVRARSPGRTVGPWAAPGGQSR